MSGGPCPRCLTAEHCAKQNHCECHKLIFGTVVAPPVSRKEELTRRLAFAHALGVRAEVVGDLAQRKEAARIYAEAKAELKQLEGPGTSDGEA